MIVLIFCCLIYILICFLVWKVRNNYHKQCLKASIQLEAYFERFNENDMRVRNHLTLDKYIDGVRILYPWEYLYAPKTKYNLMILDPGIEFNFPHTHGKYIMVHNLGISAQTIKHEEMHIYQRYNPVEVSKKLEEKNIKIIGIYNPQTDNVRANPDINLLIYDGYINQSCYRNSSSAHIIGLPSKEHPFETMAYESETI